MFVQPIGGQLTELVARKSAHGNKTQAADLVGIASRKLDIRLKYLGVAEKPSV